MTSLSPQPRPPIPPAPTRPVKLESSVGGHADASLHRCIRVRWSLGKAPSQPTTAVARPSAPTPPPPIAIEAQLTDSLRVSHRLADGSSLEIDGPWSRTPVQWHHDQRRAHLHADAGEFLRATRCTRTGALLYANGSLVASLGIAGGRTSIPELH